MSQPSIHTCLRLSHWPMYRLQRCETGERKSHGFQNGKRLVRGTAMVRWKSTCYDKDRLHDAPNASVGPGVLWILGRVPGSNERTTTWGFSIWLPSCPCVDDTRGTVQQGLRGFLDCRPTVYAHYCTSSCCLQGRGPCPGSFRLPTTEPSLRSGSRSRHPIPTRGRFTRMP